MKGPRLRHPGGGVLARPGLNAGGLRACGRMLDGEAVAVGILKAEGAIVGLVQETGLQDPQGMVHSENQWRHHGYHAFPGLDAQAASAATVRSGLLIALRADVFPAQEVQDVVDILPGKAMALDVVTAGGTLTVINVHGPGSGGDSWASKASFGADVAMYAAAKSAGGTKAVLLGGTSTCGWSPQDTPPRRGSSVCGSNAGSTGRERQRRRTDGPREWGIGWTPSCSTRHWSHGRCVSARTWRRDGLLRRRGLTMAPWSSTSR